MAKRDYYEILGVERGSSKDEIKKAYRKMAMKYHPDKNPNNKEAEQIFKDATVAAEVLLDDEKRKRYDQFGHAGVDGQSGFGQGGFNSADFGDLGDIFGDIFGDILGGGGRRKRRTSGRPGNDLQMSLVVDFEEAAFGVEKTISLTKHVECSECHGSGGKDGSKPINCDHCQGMGEIRRQQGFFTMATTCPKCQGSGQMISDPCNRCYGGGRVKSKVDIEVKIPAGIDVGQRLKLSGEGDAGQQGGPSGDLYLVIDIRSHNIFEREGFDVSCTVPISFSQAALGASIEVPTLGGKVQVNIPSGTQSGKKMRLKGKGIQKLGGHGMGDQIILVHVETPTQLTSEQRELFEKLAKSDHADSHPMGRGFFDKVRDLFQ